MFPFPFYRPMRTPSLSFRTSARQGALAASTVTFSTQDFGTAWPNRFIIVGVSTIGAAGAITVSSATIGGVSATISMQSSGGGGNSMTAILCAAVPAGATGTVVVNTSGNMSRVGIGVWAAYDLASTSAIATSNSAADPAALSLNTVIGDLIVVVGYNNTGTNATPSGYTERYDTTDSDGSTHSGGDFTATTTESPRSISLDWLAGVNSSAVCATFR